MANGALGRPKAADLAHRCAATTRTGARCGNPSMHGLELCTLHVGRADPAKLVAVSDRLVALTGLALDRLEQIIKTGTDDVAERALKTVLDRTVPKPGAQNAIVFNLGGAGPADAGRDPSEVIQRRLAELAAASTAREEMRYSATDPGEWPGEIIDAEIVDEAS